jgi:hypothetical protein
VKRVLILSAAAVVYLLSAWMVAPGFYDGFTPQSPYNFVCPPIHIANNQQPASGHVDVGLVRGASDADSAYTTDSSPQVVIGFLPGSFDMTGRTTVSVDITPVSPCPNVPQLRFVTNVYRISANAPLIKPANLVMRYSDVVPAPSAVYFASDPSGPWTSIGAAQQSQPFTIDTSASQLGYFAAGYAANTTPPPGSVTVGGGQLLPIAVAVLIIAVLVAGIPLAIIRRRQGPGGNEDDEEEAGPRT